MAPCNCRITLFKKRSEIARAKIFADFYSLSKQGKDQFISSSVEEMGEKDLKTLEETMGKKIEKGLQGSACYLPNKTESLEVCQSMFVNLMDYTLKTCEKKRESLLKKEKF